MHPQLQSLEAGLTESRQKLKEEQTLRRNAESAQDEADQRVRELEQSLEQVREECDKAHEELAFKENELEELKLELEVEKQGLQNELDDARQQASRSVALADSTTMDSDQAQVTDLTKHHPADGADDEYAKKLEEELELVTEQLIDIEKRLNEAESERDDAVSKLSQWKEKGVQNEEQEDLIRTLQTEHADRLLSEQRLREELQAAQQELAYNKEEVSLQQEELQAAEEDYKNVALQLEEAKVNHKNEVTTLKMRLNELEMSSNERLGQAAKVATTVTQANSENAALVEQIAGLEHALKLSKEDYQGVLDELDAVNARFDEVRHEARQEGESAAAARLRNELKSDADHEVAQVKEQLTKLTQENKVLQEKIDSAEVALAAARDAQGAGSGGGDNSEVVKQLQSQLARAKDDLTKKGAEVAELTKAVDEGVKKAEENVITLETQLSASKAKLAEAEARIIVLKREKERSENVIPKSPSKKDKDSVSAKILPKAPLTSGDRSRSVDREELALVDNQATVKTRNRSRSSSPSTVVRMELKVSEARKETAELQKKYDELADQKRMGEVRIKRLEEDLKFLQKQLFQKDGAVVTQMTRLSSLATSNDQSVDVMQEDASRVGHVKSIIDSKDVNKMAEELTSLAKKCDSQREYNAQLLSKMLHLQGNIQVYCRIRPMSFDEVQKGLKSVAEPLSETEVGCFDSRTNKWKSFAFDRVWGPDQSQQSVFQDVEPLALSVVDGFNACIFA